MKILNKRFTNFGFNHTEMALITFVEAMDSFDWKVLNSDKETRDVIGAVLLNNGCVCPIIDSKKDFSLTEVRFSGHTEMYRISESSCGGVLKNYDYDLYNKETCPSHQIAALYLNN